jgi:deoxyribonuclease-1
MLQAARGYRPGHRQHQVTALTGRRLRHARTTALGAIRGKKWLPWLAAWVLVSLSTAQAEPAPLSPDKIVKQFFWEDLYRDGGKTLYCAEPFSHKNILITDSYVYSLNWARSHLQCGTPSRCLKNNPAYARIAIDLHNIYPAAARFEIRRRNTKFEQLGERVEQEECGVRSAFGVIEPADRVKGNVARAVLYIHITYDLPLIAPLPVLKAWHTADPPDAEEMRRNSRIEALQGNDNPFISKPELVGKL